MKDKLRKMKNMDDRFCSVTQNSSSTWKVYDLNFTEAICTKEAVVYPHISLCPSESTPVLVNRQSVYVWFKMKIMRVEISHNDEKNGIELRFDQKPMEEVTSLLNILGFKYSYRQTMWYAPLTNQRRDFAESLKASLAEEGDLRNIIINPAYKPSLENIDDRNFSYVSLQFKNSEGELQSENKLLFDPSKKIADLIAKREGQKLFGDLFSGALIYPRNYKRKARILFEKGQVIPSGDSMVAEKKQLPVIDSSSEVVLDKQANREMDLDVTERGTQKKKRISNHDLNLQIETFIREKDQAATPYSTDDLAFIKKYTGSGGLAKKGASGKGLLYEYYTSDEIVQRMWGLAYKYGYQDGDVLEPSVGTGNFLSYAPKQAKSVAYETNPTAKRICEILYPSTTIYNKPFESLFFAGNVHLKDNFGSRRFGLAIGNPPYGDFSGRYAGMGEKKWTQARKYETYFITRCLDLLIPEGLLVFIIPSSFLKGGPSKVKEKIAEKSYPLVDAYRLPNRMFATTDIGTDILVLRKKAIA